MKFLLSTTLIRVSSVGTRLLNNKNILSTGKSVSKKMPRVPDRWEAYCPMGKVIPKTKFIAFKVPLKQAFLQDLAEADQFSPETLINTLEKQGTKLGLVIDLTFTTKYYNVQEFQDQSILHKKVFVRGHHVPDDTNFQEFVEAVKGFNKEDYVIGVHCTHGVNRTGYLICRYMIEEMGFEPEDAIACFKEARGHGIERENYLADLCQRKRGVSSVTVGSESEKFKSDRNRKPRWRHDKEGHPDWRGNHGNRHYSRHRERSPINDESQYRRRRLHTCTSNSYERSQEGDEQQNKYYVSQKAESRYPNGHASEYEEERYRFGRWGTNHTSWHNGLHQSRNWNEQRTSQTGEDASWSSLAPQWGQFSGERSRFGYGQFPVLEWGTREFRSDRYDDSESIRRGGGHWLREY